MTQLRHELQKCGLPPGCALHPIREKSGIVVFRAGDCVGKYFRQAHDRREIQYYELLRSLGVPTLRLIAKTERLLLLEDIAASGKYRLGTEQDMSDPNVARLIAAWFRQLHSRGKAYGGLPKLDLLDDVKDALSAKSIANAIEKSNSRGNPFWALLDKHIEGIRSTYPRLCNTITYNDFWWDNMAVAADGSSALMFDYHCMYRKYAYADLRHILSVLTQEAGDAFLEAYGGYSAEEKAFEDVFFPLTGLLSAYRAKAFPAWAGKFSDMLYNGALAERVRALANFL